MKNEKSKYLKIISIAIVLFFVSCSGMLDIPNQYPVGGYLVHENGTLSIDVKLDKAPAANVTIPISSSDPTEGTLSAASLVFTPANWDVAQTIIVSGVEDNQKDGNQDMILVFGAATSTDPEYSGYDKDDIDIIVIDIDTASITVAPKSGLITTEAGGTATFSVVLSSEPFDDVTIPTVVSSDGTEGSVNKATLTFTPGNYNVPQIVTVSGLNDTAKDGDIVYRIVMGTSTSLDTNYNNLIPSQVLVTNKDDDTPGIIVSNLSNNTNEGGLKATFNVKLASMPAYDVVVPINETSDPKNDTNQEGEVNPTSLTFTPANWDKEQYVTVSPVDDDVMDGNIQYVIELESATSLDPNYNGLNPNDVVANNLDNDTAGFGIVANESTTTNTSTGAVTVNGFATDDMGNLDYNDYSTFTIKLRSKPTANVTLNLTNTSPSDGTLSTSSLLFTPANWNNPQTVYVDGKSDGIDDGNHNYSINVSISTVDDKYGNTIFVKSPSFRIYSCDNDNSNLIVPCRRSGNLSTSENGGSGSFWMITQSAPGGTETVKGTSDDTTEGDFSGSSFYSVTVNSANYNKMESGGSNKFTVDGVDDAVIDGNISFNIDFDTSTGGHIGYQAPSISLYNVDNEQVLQIDASGADTSEDGTTSSFGVRIESSITITDNVTFTVDCADGSLECGSLSKTELTFTPANSNIYQYITITPLDDDRVDGTQPHSIKFGEIVSDDYRLNEYQSANLNAIGNLDNDKLIWITSLSYVGNFNATLNMDSIDAACKNASDTNKPANYATVTYKALIAHKSFRVATTTGINAVGQSGWVLKANTDYYLKSGGSPYSSKVFRTNSSALFNFGTLTTALSSGSFWTGLNSDWTTSNDNCKNWSDNIDSDGEYGSGGTTGSDSISDGFASCRVGDAVQKRIICVQQ